MKTPIQEAVAQAMFWSGIGCLPLSVAVSVVAFAVKERWKTLALLVLGGVTATHFIWYFRCLGGALATQVGVFQPVPWWKFIPIGLGATAAIAGISHFIRCEIRDTAQQRAQPCPPSLLRDRAGQTPNT
jgi:hypothetical protein